MFIRGIINSEYKHLCSCSQPVTEFLFGDNLPQVAKELVLTNKLGSRTINKPSYSRNRGYAGNKGYYKQNFKETWIKSKSRILEARVKIPETIMQNKMVSFKSLVLSKVNNFRGGQLEKHVRQWRKLTSNPNILSIISGDKLNLLMLQGCNIKPDLPSFQMKRLI